MTKGNRYLEDTLKTPTAVERADVTVVTPEDAKSRRGRPRRRVGPLRPGHLRPRPPRGAPEANALYFGVLPPGKAYAKSKTIEQPVILDWDVAHPLLQFVRDLPTVAIAQGDRRRPARRARPS